MITRRWLLGSEVATLNADSAGLAAIRAAAGSPMLFKHALGDRLRSADPRCVTTTAYADQKSQLVHRTKT
ncbi:hypothetical protein ACIQPQ_01140 [Streptomyces sp. NPDC091281]|uniref:hypothetical protein n=1 Tax=Streptomyces sp. NPDC091281 TaxID=3365985 RepID=UPI0037FAB886